MPRSCALTAVTWILLRGLTREGAHWGSFARDLSDALEGARIVTLDLPGNGASYRRRSPITVQRLIEQSRVEIEEPAIQPGRHVARSHGGRGMGGDLSGGTATLCAYRSLGTAALGRRSLEESHPPRLLLTVLRRRSTSDEGRRSALRSALLHCRPIGALGGRLGDRPVNFVSRASH
jgi:hypothetical protein